jgi:hypothetical protein
VLVVNVFNNTQALIDFDPHNGLPTNAQITGVTLNFNEASFANSNGLVSILGYGRTGLISGADATAPAALVGSYDSITIGVGADSVALNSTGVSTLQNVLNNGDLLGIRLDSNSNDTNTSIRSVEGGFAPTLTVTYNLVPEPATIGLVAMPLLALRRRRM